MNILIDSNCYKKEDFGDSFDFLLSHGLIIFKEYLLSYKVAFVGEVITPFGYFIALPKNFRDTSFTNVELVKSILKEFKTLKKREKNLITNKSYEIGGEIESDYYYWRKFYSYFTDYLTYGFYYPKKRIIKHSIKKLQGRLNPMLTEINRERIGNGITYETKNYSDNYIRNVFYSTLKYLEKKFASEIESKKINEIEKFLKEKGIAFKITDIDKSSFIKYAKKLQTNTIHEVIVKTLINYFLSSTIKEKNTINVFYTQEFEYLFEYLLQTILLHNVSFKNANWLNPNFKTLHPDIITETFIGDAKYYRISNFSNQSFDKEIYAYNVANRNSQSNFVFILGDETRQIETLTHDSYILKVVILDLRNILKDYLTNQFNILNYINTIIDDNTIVKT